MQRMQLDVCAGWERIVHEGGVMKNWKLIGTIESRNLGRFEAVQPWNDDVSLLESYLPHGSEFKNYTPEQNAKD
jgi:hypothetical protein